MADPTAPLQPLTDAERRAILTPHPRVMSTNEATGQRRCCRCHQWQDRTAFYRNSAAPFGIEYMCKGCRLAYMRDWRQRSASFSTQKGAA